MLMTKLHHVLMSITVTPSRCDVADAGHDLIDLARFRRGDSSSRRSFGTVPKRWHGHRFWPPRQLADQLLPEVLQTSSSRILAASAARAPGGGFHEAATITFSKTLRSPAATYTWKVRASRAGQWPVRDAGDVRSVKYTRPEVVRTFRRCS